MSSYQTTASKHKLDSHISNNSKQSQEPNDEQDRRGYGTIMEVRQSDSKVKVLFFRDKSKGGDYLVSEGRFLPITNSLNDIALRFGTLRKGLIVQIEWKGKHGPKAPLVTIISDLVESEFRTGKKTPISNLLATRPHLIISGGMSG